MASSLNKSLRAWIRNRNMDRTHPRVRRVSAALLWSLVFLDKTGAALNISAPRGFGAPREDSMTPLRRGRFSPTRVAEIHPPSISVSVQHQRIQLNTTDDLLVGKA